MALQRTIHRSSSFRYHHVPLTYHVSSRFSSKQAIYANPMNGLDGYNITHSNQKVSMPALGFGTWGCDHFSHEILARSVDCALSVGYRHVDCARVYANEKEIGAVIHDHLDKGTAKREDLFITSKLFNNEHAPPDDAPAQALESTLKDLNLEYVDCFMIHWPFRNTLNTTPSPFNMEQWFSTYKVLHDSMLQGLTKSVGVCNASIHKMRGLIALCDKYGIAKPGNLQIELHPYLQQDNVLQFCEEEDIIVTAAMPLGSPERPIRCRRDDDPVIMEDVELHAIAKEVGYSVAQIIIRWHLQKGVVCIPKGTEDWMIQENFDTLNFTLNDEQMKRINALDKHFRFSRAEFLGWKEDQPWEELFDYE